MGNPNPRVQFVKDNLPEYDYKFEDWLTTPEGKEWVFIKDDYEVEEYFCQNHFDEALTAHTEKLCREQREICVNTLKAAIESDYDHGCPFEDDIYDKDAEKMYEIILSALNEKGGRE